MMKLKQSLLCAALAAGALVAGQAVAAPLSLSNADFETCDLSGWSTLGSVFATPSTSVTTFDSTNWSIFAAGTAMAQLNSNGATLATIESTLGIVSGTLNALNTNPNGGGITNGAALYRSFTAQAGDSISFAWDYVARDYIPFNDPSFAILIGPDSSIDVLATINGLGQAVGTSGHSGWQTYSKTFATTGDYTLAFVTTNDKDTVLDSALFIDATAGSCNPTCPPPINKVPEPGVLALTGFAALNAFALRRRIRKA